MKRLAIIMILCLGCLIGLSAQNIWKPINVQGIYLGVGPDGSIYANHGWSGIARSQDEGETWQIVLGSETGYDYYSNSYSFSVSPEGRVFVIEDEPHRLFYSDDNGDTWHCTSNIPLINYTNVFKVKGLYAASNDVIVGWSEYLDVFWTTDGGDTWQTTCLDFLWMNYNDNCDLLVNENGDVFFSPGFMNGIYRSNLSDMEQWEIAAFEDYRINDLEFDPEGNVVGGVYLGESTPVFAQTPGFYAIKAEYLGIADNGAIFKWKRTGNQMAVLAYSIDHGATFTEIGEELPLSNSALAFLHKEADNHLYLFDCNGRYWKSIRNANDINYIEGEVIISETVPCLTQPYPEWLAIRTADNREYCVMVDGFRPNPTKMDELIVRYDTIPVGSFIGAFGTIKEMEYDLDNEYDMDNGATSSFTVIDVQQTTAHHYDAITAMLDPMDDKVKFQLPNPPYTTYYITINGEKQDWPLVFNGVTYDDTDLHTFIGHCEVMLDPYANQFNGMELQDIQPFRNYTFQMEGGTLSTIWDPLCLTLPCEDQHFLFVRWGDFIIPTPDYLMHNGRLFKDTYINNDVFREDMFVAVKGIQHVRYDIYGDEVNTVELVEMDAEEETTLTGIIDWAPMPYTSYIPVPGLELAFMANGKTYYLDNPTDGGEWFLVGNDTVYAGQEITATFTSKLLIDNGLDFYYRIHINQVEPAHEIFPKGTEWYYEIKHLNGDITHQHLEYAADTAINSKRVKIITETNTMYDKSEWTTHEYIYEDGNLVYWWNEDLEDFTLLYDFGAEVGDEWEINGGWYSITVHVDGVDESTYQGNTYRVLHVSDALYGLFSGDIICGIGHQKSFFPDSPVAKNYEVDGLRCFWQDGDLVLNMGEEDCDAVYYEIHGVDENDVAPIMVYPNPTDGLLFVITNPVTPLSPKNLNYRLTNLLGQTLLTGTLDAPTIDVSSLTNGIYFLKINDSTIKLIVK